MDTPPIHDDFDPPPALLRPDPVLSDGSELPHCWLDHYREAERLLAIGGDNLVAKAAVHAKLASILVGHNGGPIHHVEGPFLTREEAMKLRDKRK